jgi:hypothetical protein
MTLTLVKFDLDEINPSRAIPGSRPAHYLTFGANDLDLCRTKPIVRVGAPFVPSQESDRPEIWHVWSVHLGVHNLCTKFHVNSPCAYKTDPDEL